jgi:vacuolar-type H+-ATPase subunit H
MSSHQPERAQSALEPLPRIEDIPTAPQGGLERRRVQEAFAAFERQISWYQGELRSAQGRGDASEPTGQAIRLDALHLIRAAAEFADTLERDAQEAAARQIGRAEGEIRQRQGDLQAREGQLTADRSELERQRNEILNGARQEAKDILAKAGRDAAESQRQAEAGGARLLEQSRHQATELTNAARAEVERTLEWARAQGDAIIQRARGGAEQLLSAALRGETEIGEVVAAIVRAAEAQVGPRAGASATAPVVPETPAQAGDTPTQTSHRKPEKQEKPEELEES